MLLTKSDKKLLEDINRLFISSILVFDLEVLTMTKAWN